MRHFIPCLAVVAGLLWANQAFAAEAQFVVVKITARGGTTFTVKNASLPHGKWHAEGDKSNELNTNQIEGMQIPTNTTKTICACGASDAAVGTEGSFDLYDGDVKVGTYYWDCPWGKKANISRWDSVDQTAETPYAVTSVLGNLDSGGIGTVTLTVTKIPK